MKNIEQNNPLTKRRFWEQPKDFITKMCPDTVFVNGTLFNPLTKEFIKGQSIWVNDGIIVYVRLKDREVLSLET